MTTHNYKTETLQAVQDIKTLMNSGSIPEYKPDEMITLTDRIQENGAYNPSAHKLYEVIHKLLEQLEKVIFRNNNSDYRQLIQETKEELQDFIRKEIKTQLSNLLKKTPNSIVDDNK
jgi:hypothetical protein